MERSILEDDKHTVKLLHPREEWNIIAATVARLYVAYPDPSRWTYTNIMGALIFAQNEAKNTFYFRIVDLLSGKGLLWEQELYEGFPYHLDVSFFHSFSADNYVAGFSFANEHEANTFYKRVSTRGERNKQKIRTIPTPGATAASSPAVGKASSSLFDSLSRSRTKKKERPKVDKSMIGQPKNFQHLGHIGWDPQKGFSAENIPPDWKSFLARAGVSEDAMKDEATAKFVVDFVQSHGGIEAANRRTGKPGTETEPMAPKPGKPGPLKATKTPFEAPSPGTEKAAKRPPPPPPPRHRGATPGLATQGKVGAPPPPPPARPATEPPPTPARPPPAPAVPLAPPPAPAAPLAPPPPPPPMSLPTAQTTPALSSSAHPPPPAQRSRSPTPAVPGGLDRSDFLASIRSAGGITALKPSTAREQPATPSPDESAGAGGDDLASALAAALSARSKVMADESDEEDEEGGDWDD